MVVDYTKDIPKTCRILSLYGGGAKGLYTLGILNQLEALLGRKPLWEQLRNDFVHAILRSVVVRILGKKQHS